MRNTLTIVLSLGLVCVAGSLRAEEEQQPASRNASPYYGWLDKFENPSHQPMTPTITPVQNNSADTLTEKSPVEQAVQHSSTEGGSVAVSDVIFEEETAEPGEGLGCYYHRAYYSHLPMFKDDVYSLRGSFDVAETFQKPSEEVISSPDERPSTK